jgi:crotonobetainyl-CoA:carnitine CoA-transferase CaiB-like acyl-CoA transferase
MDVELDHPVAGRVHALGCPVKYSETPGQITRPAPVLGQHSFQILASLGFSAEECRQLADSKIIHDG